MEMILCPAMSPFDLVARPSPLKQVAFSSFPMGSRRDLEYAHIGRQGGQNC